MVRQEQEERDSLIGYCLAVIKAREDGSLDWDNGSADGVKQIDDAKET